MNPDTVTHCMRCTESLERGYSSRWVGDECKEVICFKCDKKESLAEHMKTGIITTNFMMDCLMSTFDIMRDAYGRSNYDNIALPTPAMFLGGGCIWIVGILIWYKAQKDEEGQ